MSTSIYCVRRIDFAKEFDLAGVGFCRLTTDAQRAEWRICQLSRISQRLHRVGIIRDIQEDECISRGHNYVQGIATHQEAQGKSGWLTNRAFGAWLFPRHFQWR